MYVTQTVENQEVFWAPCNDDTKTIQYDTKFLKSSPGRYPPLRWTVTKIEDTATEGISKFTLAQDFFNPARDNAELGIAEFYESAVEPEILETEEIPTQTSLEIAYSGAPSLKAGGGFKKFCLKERVDDKLVDVTEAVEWSVDFNGNEDKLECSVKDNTIRVKCKPDYSLIGKTFNLIARTKHSSKSLIVEVASL